MYSHHTNYITKYKLSTSTQERYHTTLDSTGFSTLRRLSKLIQYTSMYKHTNIYTYMFTLAGPLLDLTSVDR